MPITLFEKIIVTTFFSIIYITGSAQSPQTVGQIVGRANVVYDWESLQTGTPTVPLMVSNGIIGGCFDHMGFQSRPNTGYPEGRTTLGYIRNYDMIPNSRQIQFPLAIIQARFADGSSLLNLMDASDYRQELDLYTGTLNTSYNLFGPTHITAFAHQTIPNLFVMKIDRKAISQDKEIVVSIACETSKAQNNDTQWKVDPIELSFELDTDQHSVHITSTTDMTTTRWTIGCNNEIEISENKVLIRLKEESNLFTFFVHRNDCPALSEIAPLPYDSLLSSHKREWADVWATSWVDLPEERAHNIWTRMKYYAISHFPLIAEKPMIPTGLCSNIWGFTFPQDVYYVEENLPRLGHFDRTQKALKYWLDVLPDVKSYSLRIMGVEGGFFPWTPPYQDWHLYEKDSVVGKDSYELHNPAYVLAMVWHYYLHTNDKAFLATYMPVIEEVFRFYANISQLNEKGTYDVFHPTGTGQDEASHKEGGVKNYLCASYSAEYSAKTYLEATKQVKNYDKKLQQKASDILSKGYERSTLMRTEGWYTTYEGDNRPKGKQKHPVQLNPVAYLPMPELVTDNSPVMRAWENRYELTHEAKKPITLGWTFGEFALTSCRLRSPESLEKDLSAIQPCRGADPRWIQFYESSFWEGWHLPKSYYFPMMGLYLQTFTDALVQDWRGYTDLFACLLPGWEQKHIAFHGIQSGGVEVSGRWDNGQFEVTLTPVSANTLSLRVSRDLHAITANGQKKGPATFSGNQVVSFEFFGTQPIVIRGSH